MIDVSALETKFVKFSGRSILEKVVDESLPRQHHIVLFSLSPKNMLLQIFSHLKGNKKKFITTIKTFVLYNKSFIKKKANLYLNVYKLLVRDVKNIFNFLLFEDRKPVVILY